jgi:hypothetical protein
MARLKIHTNGGSVSLMGATHGSVTVTIDLDESEWGADDFNTVLGGITTSALTILGELQTDETKADEE